MVYRFETFREDKGTYSGSIQSLKVSHLSVTQNRYYEFPKWKNWMCEPGTFPKYGRQSERLVFKRNI